MSTAEQELLDLIKDKAIELGADPNEDVRWSDEYWDAREEIRGMGEEAPGLDAPPWSRHYESKQVAAQMPSGRWVSWTYWYGGGKHSEPEAIDWEDDAFYVNCKEETKTIVVRTFSKEESK